MAKLKRGEPIIVLGLEEEKILQRLQTQTYKTYDTVSGLQRLFVRPEWAAGDWVQTKVKTVEIPRSAMRAHIRTMRASLEGANRVLDELTAAIEDV